VAKIKRTTPEEFARWQENIDRLRGFAEKRKAERERREAEERAQGSR
jgi:hypothetical protein